MSTLGHQDASQAIHAHRDQLAEAMVAQQYARNPELVTLYGERGRLKYLQDANYQLDHLAESLALAQPLLFADYMGWAKVMLAGRNIPGEELATNLELMGDAMRQTLPASVAETATGYIATGLDHLSKVPATSLTFIAEEGPLSTLAHDYLAALMAGDRQRASRLILEAVEGGVAVQDVYLGVFQPCQHEIGRLWQLSRISRPLA